MKILYLFLDPFGALACKLGITGNPEVRLGVYQNSYYHGSHTATFDHVWIGDNKNINNLEKTLKNQLGLSIQKEGRGHSEWISEPADVILKQIEETIEGYRFKVRKLDTSIDIYNLESVLEGVEEWQD